MLHHVIFKKKKMLHNEVPFFFQKILLWMMHDYILIAVLLLEL